MHLPNIRYCFSSQMWQHKWTFLMYWQCQYIRLDNWYNGLHSRWARTPWVSSVYFLPFSLGPNWPWAGYPVITGYLGKDYHTLWTITSKEALIHHWGRIAHTCISLGQNQYTVVVVQLRLHWQRQSTGYMVKIADSEIAIHKIAVCRKADA